MNATVTKFGVLDMQVCVPSDWTDDMVTSFAESKYQCGTTNGWQIRREGDEALAGCKERVVCERNPANVHIMLDA